MPGRPPVASICVAAAAFALSTGLRDARADEPSMDAAMRSYYGGERASAYVVGGLGVAGAASGAVLVTRNTDFERGLGWSLLSMGALEVVGGIFYAVQVGGEVDDYGSLLAHDPLAYKREESEHMEGTTRRFVFYRLAELGLALAGIGVASYGFAADKDAFKGAGIGIAGMALPFLVIDTINNGRATRYRDRLGAFRASLTVSPLQSRGLTLSFVGTL